MNLDFEYKHDPQKTFQGLMREVLETYKPNLLTRRRRLIEDFVRDLMLNNDHIHVVEQQMRWRRYLGQANQIANLPPQRGDQVWPARKRRCLCQMLPHFCPGTTGSQRKKASIEPQELPKGSEKGKFLSLDLGGTNFRVIFMELTKDKVKQYLLFSFTSNFPGVHDGQQDLCHPCRHYDRTWL